MEKIRIGGIKLSRQLAHLSLRFFFDPDRHRSRFYRSLAENQINIVFLTMSRADPGMRVSLCVAVEDLAITRAILQAELGGTVVLTVNPSVGSVTIFPHRSSFRVLGRAVSALLQGGIPLYGLASSLSALTFVTEYDRLDQAADCLAHDFDLPANHAPLKPDSRVRQTRIVRVADKPNGA